MKAGICMFRWPIMNAVIKSIRNTWAYVPSILTRLWNCLFIIFLDGINSQQPRPGGGAFGVLADAWSHSIEEQGQKTLHGHCILWVWGWSTLLVGLLGSDDLLVHNEAKNSFPNTSMACFQLNYLLV